MERRAKSSALWGLVAGMAFLVFAQGYRLATGRGVGFAVVFGVAVGVAVVGAGLAYVAEPRFEGNGRV